MKIKNKFGLILVFFLHACGKSADETVSPEKNVEPKKISTSITNYLIQNLSSARQLAANLKLDDGVPIDLSVDVSTKTATGSINEALSDGRHTFYISYEYLVNDATDSQNKVPVATGRTEVDVNDKVEIDLHFDNLKYVDNDQDGFTNIAELILGTDWNDGLNKPISENPRVSSNYQLNDRFGIIPTSGGSVVKGTSTSVKYQIESK